MQSSLIRRPGARAETAPLTAAARPTRPSGSKPMLPACGSGGPAGTRMSYRARRAPRICIGPAFAGSGNGRLHRAWRRRRQSPSRRRAAAVRGRGARGGEERRIKATRGERRRAEMGERGEGGPSIRWVGAARPPRRGQRRTTSGGQARAWSSVRPRLSRPVSRRGLEQADADAHGRHPGQPPPLLPSPPSPNPGIPSASPRLLGSGPRQQLTWRSSWARCRAVRGGV